MEIGKVVEKLKEGRFIRRASWKGDRYVWMHRGRILTGTLERTFEGEKIFIDSKVSDLEYQDLLAVDWGYLDVDGLFHVT